ncbi:MAG TPA: 2-amino-4-hydroxy-6-hydroxymethyldihydropteridine diphosphokinase [Rhizobiaceae bacterium]|nr:2-amino-4-hydroxy-6-hydroxymethyldihydropteridine diphosphokinase [Rhizobiaceae bacterium]
MAGHSEPCEALLGLGGNVGDVRAALARALQAMDADPQVTVRAVSRLWRTPAWGRTDQPDFLNAAALIETRLGARDLLFALQALETAGGRVRRERWGPRTLDIDILFFGSSNIDEPGLTVPHPQIGARAFVLAPLQDICGDALPDGRTISRMLAELDTGDLSPLVVAPNWWKAA